MKNKDETGAAASKQAIEAKLPYLLQFLANADDDVSGTIAPFAHDYVTMLKQTVPLTDQQKEFVKVQMHSCKLAVRLIAKWLWTCVLISKPLRFGVKYFGRL